MITNYQGGREIVDCNLRKRQIKYQVVRKMSAVFNVDIKKRFIYCLKIR